MTETILVDANSADYWPGVRRRTALRNAIKYAKAGYKKTRAGMIYEAWIRDLMIVVRDAADKANFLGDAEQYREFKEHCAEMWGVREIAELSHRRIAANAADAIADARRELYGDDPL